MRIERISDKQMKFVLMNDDLEERDIKMNELSYASDKTQQLFRELMTLVQDEQEFVEGETPLMFEAMRVGVDSLVVIVTKMEQNVGGEQSFNLIPAAQRNCKYKKSDPVSPPTQANEDSYSIFSFDNIDLLADAAVRLPSHFSGTSQVYKMDERIFLALTNETEDTATTAELESVLYEYGQKHVSNRISHQYLLERGKVLINENAIDKMRMYNGA